MWLLYWWHRWWEPWLWTGMWMFYLCYIQGGEKLTYISLQVEIFRIECLTHLKAKQIWFHTMYDKFVCKKWWIKSTYLHNWVKDLDFHDFNLNLWISFFVCRVHFYFIIVSNKSSVSQWELPADWSKGIDYHILN